MSHASGIDVLSDTTRSKLRSTQVLTSLPQIVSELLQNALDARATHIDVGLDTDNWECWVRDDGVGISLGTHGFESIGQRYGTSKEYLSGNSGSTVSFGFRGEALASAADISCLEISSRAIGQKETWSIIIKGAKQLYHGPATRWRRERPGTVVYIRDAFFNLPVRRLSHPKAPQTIESVVREIKTYALMFPHVAFTLEHSSKTRTGELKKARVLSIPKTSSTLSAFCAMFGTALAREPEMISEMCGEMRLEGFISTNGDYSRVHQFLYVNQHPLSPCEIHRVIESEFATSSFVHYTGDVNQSGQHAASYKAERRPVYVLNLILPSRTLDICLMPTKDVVYFNDMDSVTAFFRSTIRSFLVRNGFLHPPKPIVMSQLEPEILPASPRPTSSPKKRRNKVNTPSAKQRTELHKPPYVHPSTQNGESHFQWIDPHTGEAFLVDARTGNSYRPEHQNHLHEEGGHSLTGRRIIDKHVMKAQMGECCESGSPSAKETPRWIHEVLKEWKNPIFLGAEADIPSISLASSSTLNADLVPHLGKFTRSNHPGTSTSRFFSLSSLASGLQSTSRRLTKEELARASIIGQVDAKFIVCRVAASPGPTPISHSSWASLILIDQHAADERVRVERFLKELCLGFLKNDVERRDLVKKPVSLLLDRAEALRLGTSQELCDALERWGLRVVVSENVLANLMEFRDDISSPAQVEVQSLPEVIADKLLMDNELQEVIKGLLARFTAAELATWPQIHAALTEDGWLKAVRWCPKELLDLVNSKACRGAIMFNDPLDLDQCSRLVTQLSMTHFPFQCAHGRPSLVPLTSLSGSHLQVPTSHRAHIDWTAF